MSKVTGFFMIFSGVCIIAGLMCSILLKPFIPKEYDIHRYFPATELILGIPIFSGILFFIGFGLYIVKEIFKNNL